MAMEGDPGLFSGIGKFIKKAVGTVGKVVSSPLGAVATTLIPGGLLLKGAGLIAKGVGVARAVRGGGAIGGGLAQMAAKRTIGQAGGAGSIITKGAAVAGGGLALGGLAGLADHIRRGGTVVQTEHGPVAVGGRRRYRRINPLNVKAARRAIRRIKGVRKITHDIERQLPRARAQQRSFPFARARRKK